MEKFLFFWVCGADPVFLKTPPVPHLGFKSVKVPSRVNHSGYTSDRQHLYLLILKANQAKQERHIPPAGTKEFPGDGTGKNKHTVRLPSGTEKWFEFWGVSTCISSRPLQELLKGPFCPHVGLAHILVRLGKQGEKKCGAASKPWRPEQVTTGAAD